MLVVLQAHAPEVLDPKVKVVVAHTRSLHACRLQYWHLRGQHTVMFAGRNHNNNVFAQALLHLPPQKIMVLVMWLPPTADASHGISTPVKLSSVTVLLARVAGRVCRQKRCIASVVKLIHSAAHHLLLR
jgi:hypothetical protein